MAEGINMGRRCPWTKEELVSLYKNLVSYRDALTVKIAEDEGAKPSQDVFAAYNLFKFPVVYMFIHYHYGQFDALNMNGSDISTYLTLYMTMTQEVTQSILEGLQTSDVFYYDAKKELSPALEAVCEEVLYILNH